jgi:DNA-binding CsgD family transcriptional regulator
MSLVTELLDEFGVAACIFGPLGRELHRTPRMRELLAAEGDAGHVLTAMRALADRLRAPCSGRSPAPLARDVRVLEGTRGTYRVHAISLPAGTVGSVKSVVVEMEPFGPLLPRLDDLVVRGGLTRREAEVALLLARGDSDREIARRLALSPHTVRKHAEHIFEKLRLHSRRELMLRLSGTPRLSPRTEQSRRRVRAAPAATT